MIMLFTKQCYIHLITPSVISYSFCSIKDAPLHTQAAVLNKTKTIDINHPSVVERKQTE